jgi:hypothetical protein
MTSGFFWEEFKTRMDQLQERKNKLELKLLELKIKIRLNLL